MRYKVWPNSEKNEYFRIRNRRQATVGNTEFQAETVPYGLSFFSQIPVLSCRSLPTPICNSEKKSNFQKFEIKTHMMVSGDFHGS